MSRSPNLSKEERVGLENLVYKIKQEQLFLTDKQVAEKINEMGVFPHRRISRDQVTNSRYYLEITRGLPIPYRSTRRYQKPF